MHGKGITRTVFVGTLVGLVLFALGGSALAAPPGTSKLGNVGQNGTGTSLGDPVVNQSEVQIVTVTVTGTPSGTFTLSASDMPAAPTAPIAFDASASAVAGALATKYGSGTIYVAGGPTSLNGGPGARTGEWYYRVQWVKAQAGLDMALMTAPAQPTGATVAVTGYEDGAVYTDRVQPHGGYSAATDYCVQCHSVHGAGGEYALLTQANVVATCQTCHSYFGSALGAAPEGGGPGVSAPTSLRAAYEVTSGRQSAHAIGGVLSSDIFASTGNVITESGWAYHAGPSGWTVDVEAGPGTSGVGGGLYCGSCHTPHGDFGALVNSETGGVRTTADGDTGNTALDDVDAWAEDTAIIYNNGTKYLHKTAAGVWQACNEVGDVTCFDLTATDTEGETAYLYGYKLLSAYPNHSWDTGAESWNLDRYGHDGARWCGECHDQATPIQYGGTAHSHPTGCTTCHGNPNDGTSSDFPHTSTFGTLLKDYPDLLCINCHTAGEMP